MTTHSTEQLALFMNARDVRDYGTAAWADLDLAGQEAYLTDAAAFVSALKALGWTPPHAPTDDDRTSEEQEEQRHGDRDADHEEQQTDDRAATRRLSVAGSHAKSMAQAPPGGKRAIAAGSRQSEVPEPQGEPHCTCSNILGWHATHCRANRNQPQGEPSDAHLHGHWSNGDPVHIVTDGVDRWVAPNHNAATWIAGEA